MRPQLYMKIAEKTTRLPFFLLSQFGRYSSAMPANNLSPFRDSLSSTLAGKIRRMVIIGDSQLSPDATPRLLLGLRNQMPFPVIGWTMPATSTVATILPLVQQVSNLANAAAAPRQFGTSSPYTGTAMFAPGTLGISPTHWFERQFGGDYTAGNPLWRGVWQAGVSSGDNFFNSFRMGSWLVQNMNVTGLYYNNGGAPSLTKFELIPYRNGSQVSGGVTVSPSGTGVFGRTITCNDSAGNAREPWVQFLKDASITEGVYDGTAVAESSLAILGAHLEQASPTQGVSITPICNAGWSAEAHASTTLCSDVNLEGYLDAVGTPDLGIIMLGHNLTTNEISGGVLTAQWKTNVQAILTRYEATMGKVPFLLVTPWRAVAAGGYADSVFADQAQAMREISRDWSGGAIGHIPLNEILPDSATLVSWGALTGSDIHLQSEAWNNYVFGRIMATLRPDRNRTISGG